ncbi:MAG TPA: sensor histidine kinase [Gemmatimonas sp.]|uniref:sensor histidine kinase n=1 Tax=Gemmatimonas sp. TaxID=1962908 RepID=UPI002EDB35A5
MRTNTWTPRTWWTVFLIAWLLLLVVHGLQVVLSMIGLGATVSAGPIVVGGILDMVAFAPALPFLRWIALRAPLERVGAWRFSARAAGVIVLAIWFSTWLMPALLTLPHMPQLVVRGSWLGKQIAAGLALTLAFTVTTLGELLASLRARERQALQLESSLTSARLQALQAQLQPHFLFNTLAAIAELVHGDSEAAGTMLTRLSSLLRASLRADATSQIPLREEVALLEEYLGIMRVRHGPRLEVTVDVPESLGDIMVPAMLLQPLVENALEHGISRRAGRGAVTVSVQPVQEGIALMVHDDGPGDAVEGDGVGLSNTRRRLEALYGTAHDLQFVSVPGVGTTVRILIPRTTRERGV